MKAGINYSDEVTTVSDSYSKEIQTREYGERLEGLLYSKRNELKGILNGIDYDIYNPKTDPIIYEKYDENNISNKIKNKLKLQERLGLKVNKNIPMLGMVSRLVYQKGLSIFLSSLNKLLNNDIQIVVLGTGSYEYENELKNISNFNKEKLSVNIYFSDEMSHLIYAASDMFIMPSLFEPCGLGQLIALRYGSVPIVRETGGLKDTIKPYNKYTGEGNGFSFKNYNWEELYNTIMYALYCYKNKEVWNKIIKSSMECDYSWSNSAERYKEVYMSLINY